MSPFSFLFFACAVGDPTESDRIEGTEPGDCTDAADNDADGTFDCNDEGCSGSPDCVEDSGSDTSAGETGENDTAHDTANDSASDTADDTGDDSATDTAGDTADDTATDSAGDTADDTTTDSAGDDTANDTGEPPIDDDADGFAAELDCDDLDPTVYPGAADTAYDGIDSNCDGANDFDQDLDGFDSADFGGADCDDFEASTYPGADDIWYDGIDSNCDDWNDYDADGDGEETTAFGGEDCNDTDPATHSAATDTWYDGVDNNCDGTNDFDQDADGDQATVYGGGDCDDTNASISSLETEVWYDGIDSDGAGDDDFDADGDGLPDVEAIGYDPGGRWSGDEQLPDTAFTLSGNQNWDFTGSSLAVGDVDGDGETDILVGAADADRTKSQVGVAYLVRGPISADSDLADAQTTIEGQTEAGFVGVGVAFLGDIDADGTNEFAVSEPGVFSAAYTALSPGQIHIFSGGLTGDAEPSDAIAAWTGEDSKSSAGVTLIGGSDFSGDGEVDLIVSACAWDGEQGAVYMLTPSQMAAGGSLASASARIYNVEPSTNGFGKVTANLGDVNGDGANDIGVAWAGYTNGSDTGAIAVFFGPLSDGEAMDADAFVTDSSTRGSVTGLPNTLASAGDVDGDGIPEMLAANPEYGTSFETYIGRAYLIDGADIATGIDIRWATATFTGTAYPDALGSSVGSAGDIDGDGSADFMIGASGVDSYAYNGGATCLFYGPATGSLDCGDAGAVWYGADSYAWVGTSAAGGIDVTGDNYVDILIGAAGAAGTAENSGAVFVLPGFAP